MTLVRWVRLLAVAGLAAILARPGAAQEAQAGRIVGRVVEAAQGAPVAGAQVEVVGTATPITATSALDGRFTLAGIPAGPASVRVRMIGFQPKVVSGIDVPAGGTVQQDVSLTAEVVQLAEIEVTAESERGSVARALDEQRNAVAIVNSVSREQIARSPDGDAAAAIQRVSGVTVQDGRYVAVRGLGDRYTQASLNGARIPSPEPEKKVVPLDLFPAALIEGITTSKTYTVDRPGDYSGAEVNIKTREFPARRTLTMSVGSGFNTRSTAIESSFAPATGIDWLAFGSSRRELPAPIAANPTLAGVNTPEATNEVVNSFRDVWSARERKGSPSGSFGLSVGGTDRLFGKELGYLLSGSYSYAQEVKDNQVRALALAGAGGAPTEIDRYEGETGRATVLWGGIANLSTTFGAHTKLSWNNTYNRTMDNDGRLELTQRSENLGIPLQIQRLRYVERNVLSTRLSAAHQLARRHRVEWAAGYSDVARKEPDRSEIVYTAQLDPSTGLPVTTSWLGISNEAAVRTFADLSEDALDGQLSYQLLLGSLSNPWAVKIGGAYRTVEREADNSYYSISLASSLPETALQLAPEQLFDGRFSSGSTTAFRVVPLGQGGSYRAEDRLSAGFAMLSFPVGGRLDVTAGVRYEHSEVTVHAVSTTGAPTRTAPVYDDVLPSVQLTYRLSESQNLRLGASRTLSRPEYRELAPLLFREVIGYDNVIGNPALRRALVDNLDLRWEWYPSGAEIVSVSLFAKRFDDPIERVYLATSGTRIISYVNAQAANNYGIELELRKNLGTLARGLLPFTLFANTTLMRSEIDIANSSASITNPQRKMVGQAPYVVNAGLTYTSGTGRWSATALYNVTGPRITEAGEIPLPDVEERPRHVLDFSLRFPVFPGISGRLDAKNLVDSPYRLVQGPVLREYYKAGRTFGLGFTWQP
ncbi:MAG TPA: TonB-dependent receptor [Gemmatimonadales bacterium]|nr:TonB-dependent receptor [Gemmatimonadales bacterium]